MCKSCFRGRGLMNAEFNLRPVPALATGACLFTLCPACPASPYRHWHQGRASSLCALPALSHRTGTGIRGVPLHSVPCLTASRQRPGHGDQGRRELPMGTIAGPGILPGSPGHGARRRPASGRIWHRAPRGRERKGRRRSAERDYLHVCVRMRRQRGNAWVQT